MDIFCLKSGIGQSDEERNAHLEKLFDSIAPGPDTEGCCSADAAAEERQQLRSALGLLASRTVESICFRSAEAVARSEEEIATLKSFLSEHEIALTVAVAAMVPKQTDSVNGRGGANYVDELESS